MDKENRPNPGNAGQVKEVPTAGVVRALLAGVSKIREKQRKQDLLTYQNLKEEEK